MASIGACSMLPLTMHVPLLLLRGRQCLAYCVPLCQLPCAPLLPTVTADMPPGLCPALPCLRGQVTRATCVVRGA
jgi:hypothetical protein